MPTESERSYYRMGVKDGYEMAQGMKGPGLFDTLPSSEEIQRKYRGSIITAPKLRKRKLSAWNKFVKANSKKPRFRYRNGKLNLKKMAVAFRKTRKRGGKR
jgi:hypothetical protein